MILIAFALFMALVIAWLSAPGKQSAPKPATAPVARVGEAAT
jgi:hypothetical protein